MKTRYLGILGALVLVFTATIAYAILPDNRNLNKGSIASMVVDDSRYCSFPGLVRFPNGTLASYYRCGTTHVSPNGVIYSKISTNQGKTWSNEILVYQTGVSGIEARDPEVTLLANGKLLLTFFKSDGVDPKGVFVMLGTIQSNNSVIWSAPIPVSSTFTKFVGESSKPIELPNGDIILPIYGQNEGDTRDSSAIVRSTDGGLTWGGQVLVALGDSSGSYSETNGVVLSGGRIVLFIRRGLTNPGYVRIYSDDNGVTWSGASLVIGTNGPVSKPSPIRLDSGAIFLLYGGDYGDTKYATSWDDGLTWSEADTYIASITTYESVTRLSGDSVGAILSWEIDTNGVKSAKIAYQDFYDGDLISNFFGSFSALSLEGNTAYFDGKVGIGTKNPFTKLHVTGGDTYLSANEEGLADGPLYLINSAPPAAGTGPQLAFSGGTDISGGTRMALISAAWNGAATTDGYLSFTTRGSSSFAERMRITSSGKIGIGTTEPGAKLQIDFSSAVTNPIGGGTANLWLKNTDNTSGNGYGIEFVNQSGARNAAIYALRDNTTPAASLLFGTHTGSSFTEKMRITSAGKVGIGATSPVSALQVGTGNNAQKEYLHIDYESEIPPSSDCDDASETGRMTLDPANNRLYVCNAASSGRGWDHIELTD